MTPISPKLPSSDIYSLNKEVRRLDIHSSSVEASEEEMLNILRSELVTNETI